MERTGVNPMTDEDVSPASLDERSMVETRCHPQRKTRECSTTPSSDQKQRLQKVLFPQGVSFANGIYKTTETSLIFKLLQESEGKKTTLATLPGIEPGLPP